MHRQPRWGACGTVVLVVGLAAGCRSAEPVPGPAPEPLDLAAVLSGDAGQYARADRPRVFSFPADHGPHPEFRNEWWYLTANLADSDGQTYGVQFTLFRHAAAPAVPVSLSAWATNQLYMAHFAVGVHGRSFQAHDRFARGALGLAGATAEPFTAWLEDWRLDEVGSGAADRPALRLKARQGSVAVDLALESAKSVVLQGDAGLSRKGAAPGSASYYYSLPRLEASGSLAMGDTTRRVAGTAWLDREWSSSVLEPEQVGWDWFALQLDGGSDLMLYVLRREDGSVDPASAGMLVSGEGAGRRLAAGDFEIEATDWWISPHSGVRYPSGWRLRVPSEQLDLVVEPTDPDQELNLAFRYWEGAVRVRETARGGAVAGVGFVELTGY